MSSTTTSNNKDLPLSTSDVTQEVQIRMLSDIGQAAIPPVTVMQHFDERVRLMGDKPALHQKIIAKVRAFVFSCLYVCVCSFFTAPFCVL